VMWPLKTRRRMATWPNVSDMAFRPRHHMQHCASWHVVACGDVVLGHIANVATRSVATSPHANGNVVI
jgi:hypothetical protein